MTHARERCTSDSGLYANAINFSLHTILALGGLGELNISDRFFLTNSEGNIHQEENFLNSDKRLIVTCCV